MRIGCDPEVFAVSAQGDLIPAFQFLPSKKNPLRNANAQKIYWDGFQAEYTTEPYACIAFAADEPQYAMTRIQTELRAKFPKAKLTLQNVFQIPRKMLMDCTKEQVELGCDASKNAYNMGGKGFDDPRKLRYRFAGGHLHFGEVVARATPDKSREELARPIVKNLDKILAVWAVGAAEGIDDPIRRQYYGLAGEHRLPAHGLEYRVLSNFWTIHPAITNLVMDFARSIIHASPNGGDHWGHIAKGLDKWVADEQEVVETINNCDVKQARAILKRNHLTFLGMPPYQADVVYDLGMRGLHEFFKEVDDLEGHWGLGQPWISHTEGPFAQWSRFAAEFKSRKKAFL